MDFNARGDPREQGWIQTLQNEIGVGEVSQTVGQEKVLIKV